MIFSSSLRAEVPVDVRLPQRPGVLPVAAPRPLRAGDVLRGGGGHRAGGLRGCPLQRWLGPHRTSLLAGFHHAGSVLQDSKGLPGN